MIDSNFPKTVIAAQAYTATTSSSAVLDELDASQLAIQVNVTAVSGTTPTLNVTVQWSMDGTTWANAETADAFNQITAATNVVKVFPVKAPYFRVTSTIGGTTPSFTHSVVAYPIVTSR